MSRKKQNKVHPDTAKRVMEALAATGGVQVDAAKRLGISQRRLQIIIQVMRDTGQEVPHAPHNMLGYYRANQPKISGTSTLLGPDGDVKLQWVKEKAGPPSPEELAAAMKLALEDLPRAKEVPAPARTMSNLLAVYPMGDPHIGMYSWAAETGQDFDLDIAEHNLAAATAHLVHCCPAAEQALIVNVGDFFHADNMENRTLRSGNVLDVDTRWAKVLRVGIRTLRACIESALAKHDKVRIINEIGNHDDHGSQMLTIAMSLYYENNPRVEFDESPARFHYFRFRSNLIGVTHGDNVKPDQLGPIMATDRPLDWGDTQYRYWYTGHIHHRKVHEFPGCTAESFRTLAARDAWTAGKGYRSGRDMTAIVLDADDGEVQRHTISLTALERMYGSSTRTGPNRAQPQRVGGKARRG